ncbi:MAG: hypothetical protein AAF399_30525, partial [Bacteroidota bacterium]
MMLRKITWGILGLFLSLSFSFLPPPNDPPERPLETWVFRAVLDEQPGALVAALHKDIWIAYDPSSGSLFRAWRGTVKVRGAVYSGQLGGQPTADGFVFHEANPQTTHWTIRHKRGDETPTVVFRPHRLHPVPQQHRRDRGGRDRHAPHGDRLSGR